MNDKILKNVVLREGISHIEDLSSKEFIRTVEALKDKIITEKMDGAALWFGIDDKGFFTSREGKSPKRSRFYVINDYPTTANSNAFRAAHLALVKLESTIRRYLENGDTVEIEVIFGRQPNTVIYGGNGKNYIVILRGVNGTPDKRVQKLSNALNGKSVTVDSSVITSPDGNKLENKTEKIVWIFTQVTPIKSDNLDTSDIMILLEKMKNFINAKNEMFTEKTNDEIVEMNLTSIPRDKRDTAKKERERLITSISTEFKLPIKELLLNNFVRKIKPFLQDKYVNPTEDIGVEGVVVRDPITGSQTKIVDRDVFTAINAFNSAVRNNISGLVKTTDQQATIESRGGAFGQAKIQIAKLIGVEELALSSATRRLLTKFKDTNVVSTAVNAATKLNISNTSSLRSKISIILNKVVNEVNDILHSFKSEAGEFKLKLKTGKEIGISSEIMKRTLTAFAETKKEIAEVNSAVIKSRTSAELLIALYGKTIEAIFDGEENMKESYELIKSIEDTITTDCNVENMNDTPDIELVKKISNNRVITRRARKFIRPKKFPMQTSEEADGNTTSSMNIASHAMPIGSSITHPISRISKLNKKKKYSLLAVINAESLSEDFSDVKDSVHANNDVTFNQLRNNVAIDGDVTPMNVNRYLNKAHEINNAVDTVTFGMETDTGSIAKVYVNASQADDFEKTLAVMLGKEDDLEQVINLLANKFDIIDVEWPKETVIGQIDVPPDEIPAGSALSPEETDNQENTDDTINFAIEPEHLDDTSGDAGSSEPEINTEINPDDADENDETGDAVGEVDTDNEETGGELETDNDGSVTNDEDESEDEFEDEDEDEERDDFGQVIDKKEKKKDTAEESVKLIANMMLEMDARVNEDANFSNAAVQAVNDMLIAMGFDVNANRSFTYQAKQLISKNSPGLYGAKQSGVLNKINAAHDALSRALQIITPSPIVTQSYSLIGSIVNESK